MSGGRRYLHITPSIRLDPGCRQVQTRRVGDPPDGNHRERGLHAVADAVFDEKHPHPTRRLLERLDGSEVLAYDHARLAEGGRDHGGNVFILCGQDAGAGLKELHP